MSKVKELFYFYPQKYGYDPSTIEEVHLIGEFNDWGINLKKLENYKFTKDKTDKWIGLFEMPERSGHYKFLLNNNTYCPCFGQLYFSVTNTPDWAKKAVWYQIMVDRFYRSGTENPVSKLIPWDSSPDYFNNFGGNLKGCREKIPYFKNLFGSLENKGFYLCPLNLSTASNHKYWPEDFEKIDPQFGTDEDLKELVDALHKEGARIILDLVYNHTGLNFFAFKDMLKNGNSSKYALWYRDMPDSIAHNPVHNSPINEKIEIPVLENYVGDKPQNIEIENDPRSENFDPARESFICIWAGKYKFPIEKPERFKNSGVEDIINNQPYYKLIHIYNKPNYKCWNGFFEIPELNTKNPEVQEYLFKAARKWIKLGIDGFRLDVPDILVHAHEFWKEFKIQMREEASLNNRNPDDIYIVGEIWINEGLTGSYLYGDKEGNPVRFDAIMNYPVRENILNFLSGEILNKATDSVKCFGEISVFDMDLNLHKNLGYISYETDLVQYNVLSSHDTRRIRTVLNDNRKLKAALIMQFTWIGAPAIYYGDEIGMSGGKDPANRAPMRWDIYENLLHNHENAEIFDFYKKMIDLRDNVPCLLESPILTILDGNKDRIYSYSRYNNDSDCVIVIIAKEGLKSDFNLDISGMPFENIMNWQDPISGKEYLNYGKSITITPEDLSDSFGLILKACV